MIYLVNPLPDLTEAELVASTKNVTPTKKAVVDKANSTKRQAFTIEFQYSTGAERETLPLLPGTQAPLQNTIAQAIHREVGEQGLCLVPIHANPLQRARRILKGLRAGHDFYARNGKQRLAKLSRGHRWSEGDLKLMVHDHRAYYVNQAKAEMILALIEKVEKKLPKLERDHGEEGEEAPLVSGGSVLGDIVEEAPAV